MGEKENEKDQPAKCNNCRREDGYICGPCLQRLQNEVDEFARKNPLSDNDKAQPIINLNDHDIFRNIAQQNEIQLYKYPDTSNQEHDSDSDGELVQSATNPEFKEYHLTEKGLRKVEDMKKELESDLDKLFKK